MNAPLRMGDTVKTEKKMKQKICTGVHLIFLLIKKDCGNINIASLWRLVLLLLASLNLWQCHFTQSRFSNPIWVHCQLLLHDTVVCAGKVKSISLVIMICCGNLMPTWVCRSSELSGTLTIRKLVHATKMLTFGKTVALVYGHCLFLCCKNRVLSKVHLEMHH